MRAHFSFYAIVALLGEIIHGNRPSLLFLDSLLLWCWVGFIGVFFFPLSSAALELEGIMGT